jgi:hypothetical protein
VSKNAEFPDGILRFYFFLNKKLLKVILALFKTLKLRKNGSKNKNKTYFENVS